MSSLLYNMRGLLILSRIRNPESRTNQRRPGTPSRSMRNSTAHQYCTLWWPLFPLWLLPGTAALCCCLEPRESRLLAQKRSKLLSSISIKWILLTCHLWKRKQLLWGHACIYQGVHMGVRGRLSGTGDSPSTVRVPPSLMHVISLGLQEPLPLKPSFLSFIPS